GYDYTRFNHIVDVAGGRGKLLIDILKRSPKTRGTIFDLPSVLEVTNRNIGMSSVKDRCTLVTGDFHDNIPVQGDCYIIKFILHAWNDEDCVNILQNIRKQMKPGCKLLVMEMIRPEESSLVDLIDIYFMSTMNGTEDEYENLYQKSSVQLTRIVNVDPCPIRIMELDLT
ncbi:hydroxyneurosporene methyltransferase-like protein, partial [Leptotrombidium deliense]